MVSAVFSVMLLLTIICTGGKAKSVPAAAAEENGNPSLTKKEIYFPEQSPTSKESAWAARNTQRPPALFEPDHPIIGRQQEKGRAFRYMDRRFSDRRDRILCDLFLDDPSVSDRHARIVRRGVLFMIIDLGSAEGTFIGTRKLYSHEEIPLTDQDTVTIGKLKFLFSQS
jgi:hypothetical protein